MKYFTYIFLLVLTCVLQAQLVKTDEPYTNIGLNFDYLLNMHTANFQSLPGVPNCCPKFESGKGTGIFIGGFYEYSFIPRLSGMIRVGYNSLNGLLNATETEYISQSGTGVWGEIEHKIDASLASVSLQPVISYYVTDLFKISGGISADLMLINNFNQSEEIISPKGQVSFIDTATGLPSGEYIRNKRDSTIPNASPLVLSFLGGVSYEFQLNKDRTLLLIPELTFNYGMTPYVKNLTWSSNSARFGLSLVYSTAKYRMIEKEKPDVFDMKLLLAENEIEVLGNPDNLIYGVYDISENALAENILQSDLFATSYAVGINEGIEESKPILHIEEFLSLNMRPLLNYIFFDYNSAAIPARYKKISPQDANKFDLSSLSNEPVLPTYYRILNIIGRRMKEHGNANITLTGCNSDNGKEKSNKQLSQQRAEAVADYLKKVWGINPSRITIKARNLPESASNNTSEDGMQENRRVEIISDDNKILEPVVTNDTIVKVNPPVIRFYNNVKSANGIDKWKLNVYEENSLTKSFDGNDSVPAKLDWLIDKEKTGIPKNYDNLSYMLDVADKSGNTKSAKTEIIPLDQITLKKKQMSKSGDKRIDYYSLILFQFNSAELSAANNEISQFIRGNLKDNSKILISGYSDRMGEPGHNLELSEQRAKNLGKSLASKNIYIRAVGANELLYDNDLPEGRFYCRTVVVEVETPIKW
ncbi:MAG: OmpA family protein [Bacteroidetes bacterium]|nr:MAG: OmpA family protein [Bacteroidota bacterium]